MLGGVNMIPIMLDEYKGKSIIVHCEGYDKAIGRGQKRKKNKYS